MNTSELRMFLKDHQEFHSDLQMDHFITIKAGGTTYGQYKQALRELQKRYHGLKSLYISQERLAVDIEELEYKLEQDGMQSFDKRRLELDLIEKRMTEESFNLTLKDHIREFNRFYAQARQLKKKIGELTPEKREKLEHEYWLHRIRLQAGFDLMMGGGLDRGRMEMIMSLNAEDRNNLLAEISSNGQTAPAAVLYAKTWEPDQFDELDMTDIPKISMEDVKRLVHESTAE